MVYVKHKQNLGNQMIMKNLFKELTPKLHFCLSLKSYWYRILKKTIHFHFRN